MLVVLRLFDSLFCFVYSDKFPRWKISSPKTDMMMNDELRLLDLDNRNLTTVHPNNLDFNLIDLFDTNEIKFLPGKSLTTQTI